MSRHSSLGQRWEHTGTRALNHVVAADVTIGTADHFVWMENRDVQRFVWISHQVLVVYHIYCHLIIETQALRVLPNWRESADHVFCRENAPLHQFSSLFTLYSGESNQSIAPEASVRVLNMC